MANLFKQSSEHVSVVLSDEDLRVAHVKVEVTSAEVIHIAKRDIRGISEEELPKIVKTVLNDLDVKSPHAIGLVPASLATTKNIEIPSINPEEIKSIINLQAGRHTPYSREEIIIDYINIGIFQRNYSKILLIIVNRNAIKKQIGIFEAAGLKVEKIVFAPEAMARFYGKAIEGASEEAVHGIIDIGNHFTDFIFICRKNIVSCRSIPVGMIHLSTEGPAAVDRLVAELKKSIEAYQSEDIEKLPDSYILTGDSQIVKSLQSIIKDALQTPVKIIPYLDNIKASQAVRKSESDLGGESFLDVVSSASILSDCQIDLLPEEVKMQHSIESQSREVVKLGALALLILILFCGLFFVNIYVKGSLLSQLKSDHSSKREEAQILERITEKTSIIKDRLNSRLASLNVIEELYRIVPDEIYLSSITLSEEGTLTIQGTSESMSRVFSLVTSLEESQLFKSVKTNSTTAKKERGKDVAAFELTFKLESAKDEEESEGKTKSKGKDKDGKKDPEGKAVAAQKEEK